MVRQGLAHTHGAGSLGGCVRLPAEPLITFINVGGGDKFIIMRKPVDSPFSPGSDTVPKIWAGRVIHLTDWHARVRPRRLAGLAERGRTVLGEPGTGKSALVRRIGSEASAAGDWVTPQLRIPVGADPLKRVASALLDLASTAGLTAGRDRRIVAILDRVKEVAAFGISLSLQPGRGAEPYTSLTELLVEIGRAALRQGGVMIMVHIDEIQNIIEDDIRSQLLVALGDALTHEEDVTVPGGYSLAQALPLAVYLTGLPEFADLAGSRTGATFARRFETSTIGAIDDDAMRAALQVFVSPGWEVATDDGIQRIHMEPAARDEIVHLSCGEPFLFQLAGERAWFAGTGAIITRDEVLRGWHGAASQAEAHVMRVLDRLPDRERQFIEAMAELPEDDRTLTRIARELGLKRAADAGPTSQRLDITRGVIRRGKPYSFRHRAVEAFLTTQWPHVSSGYAAGNSAWT